MYAFLLFICLLSAYFTDPSTEPQRTEENFFFLYNSLKEYSLGASLVTQWWRIHLPVWETQVWFLAWEAPTCCGATKPSCHTYWACAPEPESCNRWAMYPIARAPQEKPPQWEAWHTTQLSPPHITLESSPCPLQLEKAEEQQWRPSTTK